MKPGIPRVDRFPSTWRLVPFGELLEPAFRPIKLEPGKSYQLVVAKRSRGGIAPRERLRGDQIKTPVQFALRAGDFVIAKRQIIHGGCGFVPAELEGAIVSGEYDVFRPRRALVPSFLRWFTHTTYFQQTCYQSSIGVDVEKMIFQTDRWLRVPMPLPPAEGQARIASLLDAAEAAEGVHYKAIEAKRRLKRALLQRLLSSTCDSLRLGELLESIRGGVSLNGGARPLTDADVGILTLSAVADGIFDPTKCKAVPSHQRSLLGPSVSADTVLISRSNTVDLVGTSAYVDRDVPNVFLSDLLWELRVRPDAPIRTLWLHVALSSEAGRRSLSRIASGTSGSMKKLSMTRLRTIQLLVPPIHEQDAAIKISRILDSEALSLSRQLHALRRLKRGLMQKLLTGELEVPTAKNRTTTEVPA